ncbi:hypothetical protein BsWGS_22300 [Bradybaena similaris]
MATLSVKKNTKPAVADVQSQTLLSKALTPEFQWSDKDEFLDVIYWMRQIMGVVLGLIWGILPLKGFLGLAFFQKAEEEEYGGAIEILKEGLMTSFSSFLVAWIILYSALHSESTS